MGTGHGVAHADAPETSQRRVFEARDLALGGLFGALGIVVPVLFHAAGPKVGPIFLPMYLPILALGLLTSWQVAFIVGCVTPLLSSIITTMPPILPTGVLMVCELGLLAATASAARSWGLGIWPAAILALLAARCAGVGVYAAFGTMMGFKLPLWQWAALSLGTSWPGMLLQLTVVPSAVHAIEKTSILGSRWTR